MHQWTVAISDQEFAAFKSDARTRLYVHQRAKSGELTVWSNKPRELAKDLEAVIDFGATSAAAVLGLT